MCDSVVPLYDAAYSNIQTLLAKDWRTTGPFYSLKNTE